MDHHQARRDRIVTQPSQEWLDARGKVSGALDRYLVSLRNSGNLVGTLNASGPGGPYIDFINEIADMLAARKPEGTE